MKEVDKKIAKEHQIILDWKLKTGRNEKLSKHQIDDKLFQSGFIQQIQF